MRDYQKYAAVLAVFATALYFALVVAGFGVLSLVIDRDVIPVTAAGPLLGPAMTGSAIVVVFAVLLLMGLRTMPVRRRVLVGSSAGAGTAAFAAFVIVGAVAFAAGAGQPFLALTFAALMVTSPFALSVGILAFVVSLAYSWLLAAEVGGHGRPLWPWERRDSE